MATIGIIGGSGLYSIEGLEGVREVAIETPFGSPSDPLVTGTLGDQSLVFLPRHGRGHRWMPSEIPFRANIYALKTLGAEWVLSVSAVGSLREDICPGHMALPDQFIDRTRRQNQTFFGQELVAHVPFADPTCETLRQTVLASATQTGVTCHHGGTYVCIDGPMFSTRAESEMYRSWGASLVGMTAIPEAKLAREAELHYATIALVTDYDCWHTSEADVTVEAVVEVMKNNTANVKRIIQKAVSDIGELADREPSCGCHNALANTIMTSKDRIREATQQTLAPIVGRYLE